MGAQMILAPWSSATLAAVGLMPPTKSLRTARPPKAVRFAQLAVGVVGARHRALVVGLEHDRPHPGRLAARADLDGVADPAEDLRGGVDVEVDRAVETGRGDRSLARRAGRVTAARVSP